MFSRFCLCIRSARASHTCSPPYWSARTRRRWATYNLFGDTNVVSVQVDEDGEIEYVQELQGDTVGDVLSYVEYRPERLMEQFRSLAEDAVKGKRITPAERREILAAYDNGLRGYTYFEQ